MNDKEKIEEAVRLLDELEKNVEGWKKAVDSGYTKTRKMDEALRHLEELAKMIRNDQKRKKFLLGNYQSRLETIKEILDGSRE